MTTPTDPRPCSRPCSVRQGSVRRTDPPLSEREGLDLDTRIEERDLPIRRDARSTMTCVCHAHAHISRKGSGCSCRCWGCSQECSSGLASSPWPWCCSGTSSTPSSSRKGVPDGSPGSESGPAVDIENDAFHLQVGARHTE